MGNCLNGALDAVTDALQEGGNTDTGGAAAATATTDGASPVYASLPADAEQHRVRNVYDGDTLTLANDKRVRFLGVDTPELRERQPYAQEAKEYGLVDDILTKPIDDEEDDD